MSHKQQNNPSVQCETGCLTTRDTFSCVKTATDESNRVNRKQKRKLSGRKERNLEAPMPISELSSSNRSHPKTMIFSLLVAFSAFPLGRPHEFDLWAKSLLFFTRLLPNPILLRSRMQFKCKITPSRLTGNRYLNSFSSALLLSCCLFWTELNKI